MELLQTLRKIRACEGEAAAQLLLEAYVMQEVAKEMEACAKACELLDDGKIGGWYECASVIRSRAKGFDPWKADIDAQTDPASAGCPGLF